GGKLNFQLDFRAGEYQHSLGRFRLSVSASAAALAREQQRFAALNAADPWLRLGAAYALTGHGEQALPRFTAALQRADTYAARKAIMELAAHFPEVAAALAQRPSDEVTLQLALTRKH